MFIRSNVAFENRGIDFRLTFQEMILNVAKSIDDVPAITDEIIVLLRAEWTQFDWSQYEDTFGLTLPEESHETYLQKLRAGKQPSAEERLQELKESEERSNNIGFHTHDVALDARPIIVKEAKSSADVPSVIDRLLVIAREALEHNDWELYKGSFGVRHTWTVPKPNRLNDFPPVHETLLHKYQTMAEGIRRSSELIVFEGLSSTFADTYYKERTSKKTVIIHGYRYYEEPLTLLKEDAASLRELCCDRHNFDQDYTLCSFHADYCLEWHNHEDITQIIFCFSCSQVLGFRGSTEMHASIERELFKHILSAYRKNRPPNTIKY